MKKLIIVGAGGFARELLQWVKDINAVSLTWDIQGFLEDPEYNELEGVACDYHVIGTIRDWEPKEDEYFAVAIGNIPARKQIVESLKERGAKFATVIHPDTRITDFVTIGEGVIIYPGVGLYPNTSIGDFVLLQSGMGHDSIVGDYSTIHGATAICGKVTIGSQVVVGTHVTIIPEKTIGDRAYVGAGSVVIQNVKPRKKIFGNPARVIGDVDE